MTDSEDEAPPKRTFDWKWIYNGNGPLSVLCDPSPDGVFKKNGASYYYFVLGSIADENVDKPGADACTKMFVKIGLCSSCFNAGPAGVRCL